MVSGRRDNRFELHLDVVLCPSKKLPSIAFLTVYYKKLWKSLGFAVVFIGLIIFFGIVFAIWMQFSASGQEMIEAQKAVIEAAKIKN